MNLSYSYIASSSSFSFKDTIPSHRNPLYISVLGRGMNHHLSSAMTGLAQQELKNFMVGYRFHPTDYELINYFLRRKVCGIVENHTWFPDIKLCDYEPWDLPDLVSANSEDQVWYFFCPKDYKYLRSKRSNRTTKMGYWKPTGKPRKVKDKSKKKEIGTKRSLVFYQKDCPKDIRTKWIIHEYDIQGNFVLCKLKDKSDVKKTETGEASNATSPSNIESIELSELTSNSSYNEYETRCPPVLDSEKNPSYDMTAMPTYADNETDISVSEKGGWCPQFSDFVNQNQPENTDISTSANTSETTTPVEVNIQQDLFWGLENLLKLDETELVKLLELDETNYEPLDPNSVLFQPMSPTESSSNTCVW